MFDYYEDDLNFNRELTPEQFIELMYDKLMDGGIVYIPAGYDDNTFAFDSFSYRCRIDWNWSDAEETIEEFSSLCNIIKSIADRETELDGSDENAKKLLDKEQYAVWKTYLSDLSADGFDMDRIADIKDRIATVKLVKDIAKRHSEGKSVDEGEKTFLKEFIDVSVSVEERSIYNKYVEHVIGECEKRVGKNICADKLIIRAKRLYKLLTYKAPERIVNFEACMLAAMFVMHRYGKSIEAVEDSTRYFFEQFDTDDDDILDRLYKPKKQNKVKSLAPLYIFFIIKNYSSPSAHLKYKDILEHLENDYEIVMERKAVGRTVHALADANLGIYTDAASGVWAEQ